MTEVLSTLFTVSVLIFVLSSMFGLGLSLTLTQVFAPLKKVSLIARALAASFILAPLLAYSLARIIRLDEQLAIGLFILGVSAGSPLLAKLSQIAKGDLAYTLGLMVLLQVVTIIFAPLVLPLLLEDIQVDSWEMLRSLVTTMLIPLAAGLFVKARYEELAQSVGPYMMQASSITMITQVALGLVLAAGDLLGLLGTGAVLAALLFIVLTLVLGYTLGGPDRDTRVATGLGTAQRNISAAMLITVQNFAEPKVLIMVLAGAALMLVVNSLVAAELGKRVEVQATM